MTTQRAGISEEFPDEAVRGLVRIVMTFDGALIAVGSVLALLGWVAGGIEVAVLGLVALGIVALLRPGLTRNC